MTVKVAHMRLCHSRNGVTVAARDVGGRAGDLRAGARRVGIASAGIASRTDRILALRRTAVERDDRIEIVLPDGTALRVPETVGTTALRRVLAAQRG